MIINWRNIRRLFDPFDRYGGGPIAAFHVLILLGVGIALGVTTPWIYHHFNPPKVRGGLKPDVHRLPKIHVLTGFVPQVVTLPLVRIHFQGNDSACVSQTLSGMAEISTAEHRHPAAMSGGWLWNQLNQGNPNVGLTYNAAFQLYETKGMAPLSTFGADGTPSDYWLQPGPAAYAAATHHKIVNIHSIALWDRTTIERELAAGHPIAFGASWYDSWYNHWQDSSPLPGQYGYYHFDHSTLIYGYTPYGVRIANSWGSSWGANGTAILSWENLAGARYDDGTPAELVTGAPVNHFAKPPPFLTSKQKRIWNEYRAEHHRKPIPIKVHGKPVYAAVLWKTRKPPKVGGIVRKETFTSYGKGGLDGVMHEYYQGLDAYWWPRHPHWKVKWHRHTWIR